MSSSMLSSVEKLRKSVSELNKISNEAANLVASVEQFLNKECSVGIDASVLVSSEPICDDPGAPNEDTYIGYHRHLGKYRITVSTCFDGEPGTSKPWSEWNREVKLETIKKLPELILEIADRVDQHIKNAKAENDKVSELLKALQQKGSR